MTEVPLTYTVKGNVPSADLRLVPQWTVNDDFIKCNVMHFLGDEMVRNDVYVYDRKGVSAEAVAASLG